MKTWSKLKEIAATWTKLARQAKTETYALYLAFHDRRTPWYAKVVAATVVAYVVSPVDLIPDVIPVLGYLDDIILVPLGTCVAIKLIPPPVLAECRQQAKVEIEQGMQIDYKAAVVIVSIWLLLILAFIFIFLRHCLLRRVWWQEV